MKRSETIENEGKTLKKRDSDKL